ncbi:MAG: corrinoid protein [Anaerolineales bacterium]|nr:corrinoid protein [Anaerolineales bacterium]
MQNKQVVSYIIEAFTTGAFEEIPSLVKQALDSGSLPEMILDQGLISGIRQVGEQFCRTEVYLPEMMLAADAWEEGMDLLKPLLSPRYAEREAKGRVLLGTVKGDIHSLGKNMVATLLHTSGFEVVDLGIDVPASKFVEEGVKSRADIIALSALMTTTLPQQREVIEHLKAAGKRDQFYVMVGGAPTSEDWAHTIGADCWGGTAADAVDRALTYMASKRTRQ